MNLSLLLFLIGILGFVLNRKNIILMLISIEIMLLAITFLILVSSLSFDDILGQTYAIYIIAIAGAESAIGLGILVAFYRFISSLSSYCLSCGKKKTYSLPYVPSVSYDTRAVRNYSTNQSKNSSTNQSKNSSSDPWFITGLFDASEKKALVVWGTNLTSTVGVKFTLKQLAMVQLAPYQYSVIIGLILSDGWISQTSKNARLGFKQSLDKFAYIWFVFNILSHYCYSYPHLTSGIRAGNRFYGLEFSTRSMPCITELHSLFYPNGVKLVPQNIYELLTPVALAHMVMGDGSAKSHGLIICTNSYSRCCTINECS